MAWAGEIAAIATAACWGAGAGLFVTAGRRMGSVVLNRWRLTFAVVFLCGTLWAVRGSPWPGWATPEQVWLLVVSSLLGFVLGDSLYFRGLVILGAGKAALLMSMSPLFVALLAWGFLHETLGPRAWCGMALILAGLATVLYGRDESRGHAEGSPLVGIVCSVSAAFVSAIGYLLSKMALRDGLDALSGTTIRVAAAAPVLWLLAPLQGGWSRNFAALRDRTATRNMLAGAVLGPYLGVTLSLFALQHTSAAVATSIFSCFPLIAIAAGARFHAERVTFRTLCGACMAIGGVVILFLRQA